MMVQPSWIVLGAATLGGLIGLFQMPAWQLSALVGIVIGRLLTTVGEPLVRTWVNRLYLFVRFALQGGLTAEDPGASFGELRELPPLVSDDPSKLVFALALFAFWALVPYLLGRWRYRVRPNEFGPLLIYPASGLQRVVAGGLGAINGYLIARIVMPLLFPIKETVITVPGGQLTTLLDERLPMVVIGFVLVLILLGLQASGRARS